MLYTHTKAELLSFRVSNVSTFVDTATDLQSNCANLLIHKQHMKIVVTPYIYQDIKLYFL